MTQDTNATAPRQRRTRPTTDAVSFTLSVVEGPDRGERFTIRPDHPSRVLVGKSAACDLQLKDAAISRRHLAAELTGNGLRVTDLGSTNGTRVGGVQFVEIVASGGELIDLGDTRIAIEQAPETSAVPLPAATNFGRLVGASEAMRKLYPLCRKLAASDVSVVIEGETGTGKEVLAEAIHEASGRADKPFVVFDCTTIPPNLIESALFGHVRGAFTGATDSRAGVFEQAHGGTLLLDEIGDLGLELQAKLLRALQRAEVQPVGSNRWLKVDVRIIAATRRDLDAEVQAGRFRDDLFYRLMPRW